MHISRQTLGYALIAALLVALAGFVFWMTSGSAWATAQVGSAETYTFSLADNAMERARGLAGKSLGSLPADGMLFAFEDDATRTFTMEGMEFALDIIWIRDNKIVAIDRGVPAPQGNAKPVTLNSDPLLVDMVIEVPAGRAQEMNFQVGHALTINLDAAAKN